MMEMGYERIEEQIRKGRVAKQIIALEEIMKNEELIEGFEGKPIEEIIKEVAEEENMSEEEVADAIEKMMNMRMSLKPKKRDTKKKIDKAKAKKNKKQAKKSKKKNR